MSIATNLGLDLSRLDTLTSTVYMGYGYGLPVADGMQFGTLSGVDFRKTLTF